MSKKRDNKRKVEIKGYDIAKLRFQRFLAMVIDWYISNMIVAIPVTFFLRGKDYIQPYSFLSALPSGIHANKFLQTYQAVSHL